MIENMNVSHRVKGLTGNEELVLVIYATFCGLCNRRLRKGSTAIKASEQFYLHIDCGIARLREIHNVAFRQDVKSKPQTRRTRRSSQKVYQGDGKRYCSFCHKKIDDNQTYVIKEKRSLHNEGRNSCLVRFNRVFNATRNSLW